jgi:hypothetical protein
MKNSLGAMGELLWKTPFTDEVEAQYDPRKERIQHQNYRVDLELRFTGAIRRALSLEPHTASS